MSKRALCVGVDYVGQSCALNGCASDAYAWAEYLAGQGYEVTLLVDDSKPEDASRGRWREAHGSPCADPPTRANILRHLMTLITTGADHVFFSFSGHGTQTADRSGEEKDGKDEVLCPVDLHDRRVGGVISDDALRGIWQSMFPHQTIRAVHDCCHSGTGMDLAYELYERGGTGWRFIREGGEDTPGHVLLLSGCRPDQTSAETTQWNPETRQNENRGALTVATIEVLEKYRGRVGVAQMLQEVRGLLRKRQMTQIAQISSGRDATPYVSFMP